MNLHTDVPTRGQLSALIAARDPSSVSIYLPTNPSSRGEAERIELGNLVAEAAGQLREAGAARGDVDAVEEEIADVAGDAEFWRYQARSLALLATPASLMTFRLPNSLVSLVEVSDRFHLKPLLRAVTFPHTAFVLALAQGSVRLLEVAPDLGPFEVEIPGLPRDVASAAGKSSIADRAPSRRIQGSTGSKVRMRQYARRSITRSDHSSAGSRYRSARGGRAVGPDLPVGQQLPPPGGGHDPGQPRDHTGRRPDRNLPAPCWTICTQPSSHGSASSTRFGFPSAAHRETSPTWHARRLWARRHGAGRHRRGRSRLRRRGERSCGPLPPTTTLSIHGVVERDRAARLAVGAGGCSPRGPRRFRAGARWRPSFAMRRDALHALAR